MTKTDVRNLLALIAAAYPNFKLPSDPNELLFTIGVWHQPLADIPNDLVVQAFVDYQRTPAEFPPNAGQLRHLAMSRARVLPTSAEAWAIVLHHIRTTSYVDPKPIDAPAPVVETVRAMGGIRVLRQSERPEADRAHFMKMYDTYAERALRDVTGEDIVAAVRPLSALEAD